MSNPDRIHGRTIKILEEEGLARAANSIGRVLDMHGKAKHGTRGWVKTSAHRLFFLGVRHATKDGVDPSSGEPHRAHGGARFLMLLAKSIGWD